MNDKELTIKKINFVIEELIFARSYQKNQAANHFVALRRRIVESKKLTKKMKENLSWIEENVKILK